MYKNQRTPLHGMCSKLNISLTDLDAEIQKKIHDLDAQDNGWTALHYTVTVSGKAGPRKNSLQAAQMLLEAGADPNLQDKDGWPPLYHAGKYHLLEHAKLLLEHGADPMLKDKGGRTAQDLSARYQWSKKMMQLVGPVIERCWGLPESTERYRTTRLHRVCNGLNIPLKELGIAIKTNPQDIDAHEARGNTALLIAVWHDPPEATKMLLEAGANPNIQDFDGWTALYRTACLIGPRVAQAQLLLQHGADPNIKDKDGKTPLDVAKERKHVKLVELLQGVTTAGSATTTTTTTAATTSVAMKAKIQQTERSKHTVDFWKSMGVDDDEMNQLFEQLAIWDTNNSNAVQPSVSTTINVPDSANTAAMTSTNSGAGNEDEVNQLRKELETMKKENHVLQKQNQHVRYFKEANEELLARNMQLSCMYDNMDDGRDPNRNEMKRLMQGVQAKEHLIWNMKEEVKELHNKILAKDQEIQHLKGDILSTTTSARSAGSNEDEVKQLREELETMKKENNALKIEVQTAFQNSSYKDAENQILMDKVKLLVMETDHQEQRLQESDRELESNDRETRELKQGVQAKDQVILSMKKQVNELNNKILCKDELVSSLDEQLKIKDKDHRDLNELIQGKDQLILKADKEIQNLKSEVRVKDQLVSSQDQELKAKDQELHVMDQHLTAKSQEVGHLNSTLQELQGDLNVKDEIISSKDNELQAADQKLEATNQGVQTKDQEIQNLKDLYSEHRQQLQTKDQKITQLEQLVAQLQQTVMVSPFVPGDPCKLNPSTTEQLFLAYVNRELFAHGGGSFQAPDPRPVNGFKCLDVTLPLNMPENAELEQSFSLHIKKVTRLRANSLNLFNFLPKTSEQTSALELFKDHFHVRVPGTRKPNTIYAYHGCSADVAETILKNGFANLAQLDAGYFGRGIYVTVNPEYACQYAAGFYTPPGKQPPKPHPRNAKRFAVVMCVVCVSMAYPITPSEDYPTPARPDGHCKYFGQPLEPQFDAHFAPVHRNTKFEAVVSGVAEYGELVFGESAQLYPIAILWVEEE